jgi:DNA modification methylase
MTGLNLDTIECADVMDYLRGLPDACVNLVVTSPPYFGLRDYGTAAWDGGDPACDHRTRRFQRGGLSEKQSSNHGSSGDEARDVCPKCGARRIDQQIGLEATPAAYVARMVDVFREVRRVIRDDASVYVNLGDSYSDKQLLGIPWRFVFAMQDAGWLFREEIIWQKPNPMPESVRDRCTRSHEYIFHFTKSPRYWYDAQAVAEDSVNDRMRGPALHPDLISTNGNGGLARRPIEPTRNRRSVWTINPANFREAHFATFPEDIPEICIKAACPEWCCDQCGAPYEAQVERVAAVPQRSSPSLDATRNDTARSGGFYDAQVVNYGYAPSCACNAGKRAGVVLDPFMGAGTVAMVAKRLHRCYIGCDLNAEYVKMARARVYGPLFSYEGEGS